MRSGMSTRDGVSDGLYLDLDIVEPDDDPLSSCLADRQLMMGLDGAERPTRRPVVAPVAPELVVRKPGAGNE